MSVRFVSFSRSVSVLSSVLFDNFFYLTLKMNSAQNLSNAAAMHKHDKSSLSFCYEARSYSVHIFLLNNNNTPRTRHGQNTKKDIHNEINSIQSISTYSFLSSSVLLSSLVNRNSIHRPHSHIHFQWFFSRADG